MNYFQRGIDRLSLTKNPPLVVFKRVIYILWVGAIIGFALFFLLNPKYLLAENLKGVIEGAGTGLLTAFVIISFLRGFFMVPSSPFVLAGGLLFPSQPVLVVIISIAGILFSATLVYYYSDSIGINKFIKDRYPDKIEPVMEKMQKSWSIWLVIGWSMFPLVPTDLICYAAGLVKMPFHRMLIGLTIGEIPLVCAYVYFGKSIMDFIG